MPRTRYLYESSIPWKDVDYFLDDVRKLARGEIDWSVVVNTACKFKKWNMEMMQAAGTDERVVKGFLELAQACEADEDDTVMRFFVDLMREFCFMVKHMGGSLEKFAEEEGIPLLRILSNVIRENDWKDASVVRIFAYIAESSMRAAQCVMDLGAFHVAVEKMRKTPQEDSDLPTMLGVALCAVRHTPVAPRLLDLIVASTLDAVTVNENEFFDAMNRKQLFLALHGVRCLYVSFFLTFHEARDYRPPSDELVRDGWTPLVGLMLANATVRRELRENRWRCERWLLLSVDTDALSEVRMLMCVIAIAATPLQLAEADRADEGRLGWTYGDVLNDLLQPVYLPHFTSCDDMQEDRGSVCGAWIFFSVGWLLEKAPLGSLGVIEEENWAKFASHNYGVSAAFSHLPNMKFVDIGLRGINAFVVSREWSIAAFSSPDWLKNLVEKALNNRFPNAVPHVDLVLEAAPHLVPLARDLGIPSLLETMYAIGNDDARRVCRKWFGAHYSDRERILAFLAAAFRPHREPNPSARFVRLDGDHVLVSRVYEYLSDWCGAVTHRVHLDSHTGGHWSCSVDGTLMAHFEERGSLVTLLNVKQVGNRENRLVLRRFDTKSDGRGSFSFSPKNRLLACSSQRDGFDMLDVFDLASSFVPDPVLVVLKKSSWVFCRLWDDNEQSGVRRSYMCAKSGKEVAIWEFVWGLVPGTRPTTTLLWEELEADFFISAEFSTSGARVALQYSVPSCIRVLDLGSGKTQPSEIASIELGGSDNWVKLMDFVNDSFVVIVRGKEFSFFEVGSSTLTTQMLQKLDVRAICPDMDENAARRWLEELRRKMGRDRDFDVWERDSKVWNTLRFSNDGFDEERNGPRAGFCAGSKLPVGAMIVSVPSPKSWTSSRNHRLAAMGMVLITKNEWAQRDDEGAFWLTFWE